MVKLDEKGNPKGKPDRMEFTFPTDGTAEIHAVVDGMKMQYINGKTFVWDNKGQAVSDTVPHGKAKFVLPTFQYILSLPWKLLDPGTRYALLPWRKVGEKEFRGVHVTYGKGIGDTPEDWYKFYIDPETNLLRDVLWIVTAPVHKGFIEWCRFKDYREVEGVLIPHRMIFTPAKESGEETGPPIFEVRIVNVSFEGTEKASETRPASRPARRPATRP